MSLRSLFVLAAAIMALLVAAPVAAAPLGQASVEEVIVTSTSTFTLTVRLDEVTTLAIPLQVDWRAEGPDADNAEEVTVVISPTVLETGIFSVTVGQIQPTTGTLVLTLDQPVAGNLLLTGTTTTTATGTITDDTITDDTVTDDTTVSEPDATGPTANAISNLRAGPGTDYAIVGSAAAGDALDVIGQNNDGTWLNLANGAWIATFLVDNAPTGLPVVEPVATPLPSPTTAAVIAPTNTPEPTVILTPTVTTAP